MKVNSLNKLASYFENNEVLVFESKVQKLSRWKIFLFSLAGRDFNPMHCVEGFEKHSIFKSVVSQGSGIISRAEGYFVSEFKFEKPTEIIASGIDNLKYYKSLPVNSKYKYIFEIKQISVNEKYCKYVCKIKCILFEDLSTVASWDWNISFIPVKNPPLEQIKVRSYFFNVIDFLIFRPFEKFFMYSMSVVILFSLIRIFTDICGFTQPCVIAYECMGNF